MFVFISKVAGKPFTVNRELEGEVYESDHELVQGWTP